MDSRSLIVIGIAVMFIGFILMSLGIILSSFLGNAGDKIEGGGVVMIGPIPISFGTSTETLIIAMFLAVLLMVLWVIGSFFIK